MAKTVFRPNELKPQKNDLVLRLIHDYTPVEDETEKKEVEYTGPTAADLRKEAEAFRKGWEIEKERMLKEAQKSADDIVKKAEESAFAEMKRQTDHAAVIKTDAEQSAQKIVEKAHEDAKKVIDDAEVERGKALEEAKTTGYDEGRQAGYNEGLNEANRLIERLHKMLDVVMSRREEILKGCETQIVELVILMTRKVVKTISDNQKSVITNNVLAALHKVKGRGDVTIRVNMEDVELTTSHIDDFIKRVENVGTIHVVEDSTVDKGGCIVETDFGAVDARIASQLAELETKIMEISPIREVEKKEEDKAKDGEE